MLTNYNGVNIAYDAIGNQLNDDKWSYYWQAGRELYCVETLDRSEFWYLFYNADGLRFKRVNDSRCYSYKYAGDLLTRLIVDGHTMKFTYDAEGSPIAMEMDNGYFYYYVTNLQGDIIAILDSSGSPVVQYTYDAWGNILTTTGSMASTVGYYNPLRYRGYVYDEETGLYYLQSRYYNPEIGRFISADDTAYLGTDTTPLSYNLYSYCKNNPVMLSDPTGYAPEWWQWVISGTMVVAGIAMVATGVGGVAGGALICAGANSIIGSYVSEATGGSSVAGWTGGMITGAFCGTGAGFAGNLFISATNATGATCLSYLAGSGMAAFGSGFTGSLTGQGVSAAIDGRKLNAKEAVCSAIKTGTVNCLSGIGAGIGNAIKGMPEFTTTTTTVANSVNSGWSAIWEMVCDFLGVISIGLS